MGSFKLNPITGKLDMIGIIVSQSGLIASAQVSVIAGAQTISLSSCTPSITMPSGSYEIVGYVDDGSGTQSMVGISSKTQTNFTLNSPLSGTFYFIIG